jgi:hypothetical protein
VTTSPATSATQDQKAAQPEWQPHIWEGSDFFAWVRLLARNRFAVHPRLVYVAVIVTFVSMAHTALRWLQQLIYGRKVARTKITEAPLFIVGHWRTGTTLLHEFLILDDRHNYPTTYECMEPNHFLLTEGIFTRWLRFLTPSRRPMDNMAAGFDRPQEDEFALCMLGEASPYSRIAFPNRLPERAEYLDLDMLPAASLASWKRSFHRFLQQITFRNPKRLVLKSPPHSARIKVLLDLFPEARFVHIVRDPYVVFPSTVNLWKSLYRVHGLQRPTFAGLEDYVLNTFVHLYEKLEEGKQIVPAGRFHEVRYEELVRDPVGEMRKLYECLELGGFEQRLRPRLESYLETIKGYETNRYQVSPKQRAEIERRWGEVIRRYGYG